VVIEALCSEGPLLDSFNIDLRTVQSTPAGRAALAFLREVAGIADDSTSIPRDLMALVPAVHEELVALDVDDLALWIQGLDAPPLAAEAAECFWEVFAPGSAGLVGSWGEQVARVRDQRLVTVDPLERVPLDGNILFTSNVLLTSPDASDEQRWYFDHPMVFDADVTENEVVHGLRGLDSAIRFEKDRGTLDTGAVVDCVLSVSVTHESLNPLAREEARRSVGMTDGLENVAVFAFTEADTQQLVIEVLAPAFGCDPSMLAVFGVNGNYGRHYSFGKAIAALWREVVDADVDRTFKFDLDQTFPQEQLVEETGGSALELLSVRSQWGASGVDSDGEQIELGMCAGALVNESDIHLGLFTADIERPTTPPTLPDLLFRKAVPQALSTEAEMMDHGDVPPGSIRQRVHVTGGTTGITVDALTNFRPFTPSFITRAEDQAYLLSVLTGPQPRLRTVHIPGLFMSHDKRSVAHKAIITSEVDTAVGDYERMILFTGYSRALGPLDTSWLGPFTGSYISEAPLGVALVRLMLDVIDRTQRGDETTAADLLLKGPRRIADAYELALSPGNELPRIIATERAGWNRYFDAVAALRHRPDLCQRAASIIESTRLG